VDDDTGEPRAETSSSASALGFAFSATPHEGSTMRMRLMQRPQITTLALPRSHTWPSDLVPPHQAPFHFLPDVYNYAKFMLATPAYLISNLTRDIDALSVERRILAGMHDDLGTSFVDAAEMKVRHQIEKAAALESPHLKEAVDKAIREQSEIKERFALLNRRKQEESMISQQPLDVPEAFIAYQSSTSSAIPAISTSTHMNNRNPRQRRNLNPLRHLRKHIITTKPHQAYRSSSTLWTSRSYSRILAATRRSPTRSRSVSNRSLRALSMMTCANDANTSRICRKERMLSLSRLISRVLWVKMD
jgi:hypothetical protein